MPFVLSTGLLQQAHTFHVKLSGCPLRYGLKEIVMSGGLGLGMSCSICGNESYSFGGARRVWQTVLSGSVCIVLYVLTVLRLRRAHDMSIQRGGRGACEQCGVLAHRGGRERGGAVGEVPHCRIVCGEEFMPCRL